MIPLAGSDPPHDGESLAKSIRTALAERFDFGDATVVEARGGEWPALDALTVDLGGATVRAAGFPGTPVVTGGRPGITAETFRFSGRPLRYEGAEADLELTATNAHFAFGRGESGAWHLEVLGAAEGRLTINVAKDDLGRIALAVLREVARPHGVQVAAVDLALSRAEGGGIALDAKITAVKMMRFQVKVTGLLEIGDDLTATPRKLIAAGVGMAGKMAAGFVGPKLRRFEGRPFPLAAVRLGGMALTRLEVDVENGLSLAAGFGPPR
jgi:hypothetical protein